MLLAPSQPEEERIPNKTWLLISVPIPREVPRHLPLSEDAQTPSQLALARNFVSPYSQVTPRRS